MNCDRVKNRNQRQIIQRIIIRAILILETPTCLGSGDADGDTDLMLLRDSIEDKALLMGSSIAGSLRNYLREHENGYNSIDQSLLFGGQRSEEKGDQSPLIVDDALSNETIKAELRDGVRINSITKTAVPKAKYDLELLEAGTKFDLSFELAIAQENDRGQLITELAIALRGLEQGEITIGTKKRRGFGRCKVEKWQVWEFDLQKPDRRKAWLDFPHWSTGLLADYPTHDKIEDALGVCLNVEDKRDRLTIRATFTLTSPLLIRSGQNSTDKAPDVVHLKSHRPSEENSDRNLVSVLSGTSLAGVLRSRAERIVNTLGKNINIIDEVFGLDINKDRSKQAKASRLVVNESVITETTDFVQNRIAIDRFTGGALHGALFNEQPIFGSDRTELKLELLLRDPQDCEIGLLLLLLKDLWTGDLPVGGTSSIGRGRLQGKEATITLNQSPKKTAWTISQPSKDKPLVVNDAESLEKFVAALYQEVIN